MFNNVNQLERTESAGLYVGKVVDNKDPKKLQRVRVEIPNKLTGEVASLPWCFPAQHSLFGMTESAYSVGVPVIGSTVIVEFQEGDLHYGCVTSNIHTAITTVSGDLAVNYPNRRGWLDPANNLFYIDITSGSVVANFLHKSGTRIRVEDNGDVIIHSVADIKTSCVNWSLDASSSVTIKTNTIQVNASSTTIDSNISTNGSLTNNGINVSSTHTHHGVTPGLGSTSTPD